ncbi:hypothetical protein AB0C69_24165 [Actinomadura sp. NPDC048032]|uniref:hypothetical protein n=1 Tax=Actinomadura sp. NPDC048032 TaxID=3155747 RepID=UPI0033D1908B
MARLDLAGAALGGRDRGPGRPAQLLPGLLDDLDGPGPRVAERDREGVEPKLIR